PHPGTPSFPTRRSSDLSLGDAISILRQGRLAGTIDHQALRTKGHDELRAEIVRIMFGEAAPAVADVAELREELVEAEASVTADADRKSTRLNSSHVASS